MANGGKFIVSICLYHFNAARAQKLMIMWSGNWNKKSVSL